MSEPVPRQLNPLATSLSWLAAPDRVDAATRQAAVLVPFFTDPAAPSSGLSLVLVEKSRHLRSHAGQIAFPGGSVDPDDDGVRDAALREAREEVGIEASGVKLLGLMEPVRAVTGHHVTPVVGWWMSPSPLVPVDTIEVAAVHTVRVDDLSNPQNRQTWRHRLGFTGPAFLIDELFIWGLTAKLINTLLRLGGWEQPWDRSREAPIPARFDGASGG